MDNSNNLPVGVTNTIPVANAGDDKSIETGTEIILDASKSVDLDNDQLTYRWFFDSIPSCSTALFTKTTTVNPSFISFGRSLGYMNGSIMGVHGAGSKRSNDKLAVSSERGALSANGASGVFYYKDPQGDILRNNNMIRCVRDIAKDN